MSDTLDDFIKRYIQNKKLSDTAESYSEWLSSHGGGETLAKRLAEIEETYRAERSTYGARAERLAAAGLTASGYSDYLSRAAEGKRKSAREAAYRDAAAEETKSRKGYADYLTSLSEKRSKLIEKAYTAIQKDSSFDLDAAYERALSLGLDEESAAEVARESVAKLKEKAGDSLRKKILDKGLSADSAISYAMALGFDREEATTFGDLARENEKKKAEEEKSESKKDTSYTDYLRDKLNKK